MSGLKITESRVYLLLRFCKIIVSSSASTHETRAVIVDIVNQRSITTINKIIDSKRIDLNRKYVRKEDVMNKLRDHVMIARNQMRKK